MQIRVRERSAKCRRCGGIEFAPVKKGAIGLADWFYCLECLTQRVHADLMVQIGEEVMKQTNDHSRPQGYSGRGQKPLR